MKLVKSLLGVGTLALGLSLGALPVEAQPHGHGAHRGHRGHGGMHRVLRQLSLSENQQAQVRAILESARERRHELRNAGRSANTRTQMRALRQETRQLIRDVLTPAQVQQMQTLKAEHRSRRIERRLTRLTERLSLTNRQANRIRTILNDAHPSAADGPPAENRRQRRAQVKAQIEAELTPAQLETFRQMRAERRARRGNRGNRERAFTQRHRDGQKGNYDKTI